VLYHYKFLDGHLHKQAAQAVREGQYYNNSALYKKYLQVLERNPDLRVKQETAREIGSVNDLVENGFLVISEEYMVRVFEEEDRKNGGYHAPRWAEPGGGPRDEAAFYKARAEAKVQRLRARRLERRLEALRDQNRRELQKLREHNQRRTERLARRLARTKKRAKKKNRALANQLRSIRTSRSWRLLDKLGRLRAKVLGRNPTKQAAPKRPLR
jgi:predicted RNase H-like nuclease (RuvC/YqgF family)